MFREVEAAELEYNPSREIDDQQADSGRAATLPSLPDQTEATVWLLSEREGLPQHEIADRLKITQGAVSKALGRGRRKIDDFVSRGLITLDRLELELRRGVGLAPRS